MHDTLVHLQPSDFPGITRKHLEVLQVNLGYLCNLSCSHCHVNAGPKRTELMDKATVEQVIQFIDQQAIRILDLTGGAPEMNPWFCYLVTEARKRDIKVIDRCNLVILQTDGYRELAPFIAAQAVEVVASLPCYLQDNVDKQRGKGTFAASIAALQELNALGYGQEASGLELHLVFNPQGPNLPPDQQELEAAYKSHLQQQFGIVFNRLYALTNLPIQRFGSVLLSKGQMHEYLALLKDNFNAANLEQVMCRNTLSVDWQGFVYDCDFNQMLGLPLGGADRLHLSHIPTLTGKAIYTLQHCYACTAGRGSSCSGVIT